MTFEARQLISSTTSGHNKDLFSPGIHPETDVRRLV